jgi:hypothetical protein
MTISAFDKLKSNKVPCGIPDNTNDLINGLFLTINTTSKDFDYANAYEILPEVVSKFYDCIGAKPFSLKPYIIAPTKNDIDIVSIGSQVFAVCSIGLNKTGEKTHIHMWVYNLHSFNIDYGTFCKNLTKKLKGLNGISKRNEFSVKLVPCIDPIDSQIRQSNYNNQVIINYIKNHEYNTLMNYFATKNDKNFIYFY